MQHRLIQTITVLVTMLALCGAALAQRGQTPARPSPTGNLPFDSHDFSGVWQFGGGAGGEGPGDNFPPLTAYGKAKYDAAKPGYGPKAAPLGNDPMLKCDPMGFPRILYIITPFEFHHVKNRIVQIFEWQHTWREIWMDGRKLPEDPDPTWYGYSVGHWDGDTLVVETNGFNDRTWLGAQGQPHSEELKTTERYRRIDHDTIQFNMTIDDPKTYTKVWEAEPRTIRLLPAGSEIGPNFCVPSDEEAFLKRIREPAGRSVPKKK